MIDVSAFQLPLTLLINWLDSEERDVLRYVVSKNGNTMIFTSNGTYANGQPTSAVVVFEKQ